MSDKPAAKVEDETPRLRARIRELEAQVSAQSAKKDDDKDDEPATTRRIADSWNDVTRSKRDATNRMVRGAAMASAEFVRAFADTVSSFADTVISRNEGRTGKNGTVREMVTRLPEDVATSMADAVDRFVEIPAKAAERYSKSYREGEKQN